jgi:hypothetical protein
MATTNKKQILIKKAVERQPGFLYYIDKLGNLCAAAMTTGSKKGRRFIRKKSPVSLRTF